MRTTSVAINRTSSGDCGNGANRDCCHSYYCPSGFVCTGSGMNGVCTQRYNNNSSTNNSTSIASTVSIIGIAISGIVCLSLICCIYVYCYRIRQAKQNQILANHSTLSDLSEEDKVIDARFCEIPPAPRNTMITIHVKPSSSSLSQLDTSGDFLLSHSSPNGLYVQLSPTAPASSFEYSLV
jgi:hypothetical protein